MSNSGPDARKAFGPFFLLGERMTIMTTMTLLTIISTITLVTTISLVTILPLSLPVHCESLVLCRLHQLAFARTLVVDAAEMEYAVYDDTQQLVVVRLAEELGVRAYGVERDDAVSYTHLRAHET